jgi:hypothetical protein
MNGEGIARHILSLVAVQIGRTLVALGLLYVSYFVSALVFSLVFRA